MAQAQIAFGQERFADMSPNSTPNSSSGILRRRSSSLREAGDIMTESRQATFPVVTRTLRAI